MELTVCIERERSTLQVQCTGTTVNDLLKQLQLNPEAVLVVRNQEVLIEKELLHEKDTLEILSVISGG